MILFLIFILISLLILFLGVVLYFDPVFVVVVGGVGVSAVVDSYFFF